jgi:succinate dehydrogenase hydrophobic anchor subunit
MARAGTRMEVSERVLNHAVPGVRHVYDRYEYEEEKKCALELLTTQIMLAVGIDRWKFPKR